jgi:hypothetical protein
MDHSTVLKDSCAEHEKRLRHYLSEYAGLQPLSVERYRDVYERTLWLDRVLSCRATVER